ncbi:ATP-binding protein [Methylocaldum sp. 14B]|uniref:sensor histidine kinase n=1 Tax=Methylocaldum sp. 14B TaxID=1912213 RepID=UPI001F0B169E|nr:ATP-binding protein [Methylocaldum sp. 14B]
MRIVTKLSLSLLALSMAVFGAYGVIHVQTERNDLHTALERETRLLAYGLQVAVENALRDRQLEDVRELLRQLERIDPSVDVRVYIRDGRVVRSDAESLPWAAPLEAALHGAALGGASRLLYYPDADPEFIALSLPFSEKETAAHGSLAVVRSLEELRRDLRRTERDILISLASFVASTSLLCLALGRVYISGPLRRLGDAMRRFRGGNDPPDPLPIDRRDELSAVAEEFNRMVAELSMAHRRLDTETEKRRQLQRALQEADKLITIGQLSAGLAHEIGSPLQVVNGRARALAACADRPEEVRRLADILVAQTDRITRIVQRLLEFARRRPPNFVRIDVASVIGDVLDLLRHEAGRRRIELKFEHPDLLPPARVNADGVQQIILNLVGNALAATEDGGVITVDLRESAMVTNDTEVPALRLIVADTGSGIAPEHLPRLFEPFFTTRGGRGGTGLGLAVVKTIVTEHDGTIAAESKMDKGSRFTVHLPLNGPSRLKEAV